MEGLTTTQQGAPLSLGGLYTDGELRYAVEIPNALSLLVAWDPDAEVAGLDAFPADTHPPVNIVKWSFQLMVAIGLGLLALSAACGTWSPAGRTAAPSAGS